MNSRNALILPLLVAASHGLSPTANAQILGTNAAVDENPKPTWETQKQAMTYRLGIPAPRGQITDRNGYPFAQNRLSYNLVLQFPSSTDWDDNKALSFARQQITFAKGFLGRPITLSDQAILTHYRNRALLPLPLIEDLRPEELAAARRGLTPSLQLQQVYARLYPNGELASHIIGYTGKEAPLSTRPIENKDLIFTESEGREGIEQTFDFQLKGKPGSLHVTYDAEGRKTSERIAQPPVPGDNVITTLDQNLQRICEKVLKENAKRGAIVFIDPGRERSTPWRPGRSTTRTISSRPSTPRSTNSSATIPTFHSSPAPSAPPTRPDQPSRPTSASPASNRANSPRRTPTPALRPSISVTSPSTTGRNTTSASSTSSRP